MKSNILKSGRILFIFPLTFLSVTEAFADKMDKYPGFSVDQRYITKYEKIFKQQEKLRDKITTDCMAKQGFKYVVAPAKDLKDIRTAEEAEEYARLVADLNAQMDDEIPDDPRSYHLALYGVEHPYKPEGGDIREIVASDGGGCRGAAYRHVLGIYDLSASLKPAFRALDDEAKQDPEVHSIEEDWRSCMLDKGHSFNTRVDMHMHLNSLKSELETSKTIDKDNKICQKSVDYKPRYKEIRKRYRELFAETYKPELKKILERVREAEKQLEKELRNNE